MKHATGFRCTRLARALFWISFVAVFLAPFKECHSAELCKTFLYRIGGALLSPGDELYLAKYNVILCNRFHYDNIKNNTWKTIKTLNPGVEIYLYIIPSFVYESHDSYSVVALNDLGRYGNARGHPMGDLNDSNPDLFLLDAMGQRIHPDGNSDCYFLDFGSPKFQKYVLEALGNDIVNQRWRADGIFVDDAISTPVGMPSAAIYATTPAWVDATNSYVVALTQGLDGSRQKCAVNRGNTRWSDGCNAWIALDASSHPPAAVLEEGAFAVGWGYGDVQFFPESDWKNQVDLLANIHHSKVLYLSHCKLGSKDASGKDNYNKPFTFWDAFYYSLGSFLLGRNDADDNSYFEMNYSMSYSKVDYYYDEYDKIHLGRSEAAYKITKVNGVNVYSREFDYGYVFVNPTGSDVARLDLPGPCKLVQHANLDTPPSQMQTISSLPLPAHRSVFVYKVSSLPATVGPPVNLRVY
jgi:hypothetical protein